MNKIVKKIFKGTIAIIAIKLLLVSGIFLFQSCVNDSFEIKNESSQFLKSLKISSQNINDISLNSDKENGLLNKMQSDVICIRLGDLTLRDEFLNHTNNNLNTLGDVVETRESFDTTIDINDTNNSDDCILEIGMPTQSIIDALAPTIQEAKSFLYTKGLTEQDINDMIIEKNGTDEDLIVLAMLIAEDDQLENSTAFNYSSIFINSAYSQDWGEIGRCAAYAVGADLLFSIATMDGNTGNKWKKKAIKKLFGKIASRMLGPLGVAVAVISFGLCMNGTI